LAVLSASACVAPVRQRKGPVASAVDRDAPQVVDLVFPRTAAVTTACTPTGPETCFDATDNNCNGVIDEGCGVHTGPLQIAIAWDQGSDVDLVVTDPKGAKAEVGKTTAGGLCKDFDCGAPNQTCHGQYIENVYAVGDRPAPGRYEVRVRLVTVTEGTEPIRVHFGAKLGARIVGMQLELYTGEGEKAFAFTVR
jgi:hypothetical protein